MYREISACRICGNTQLQQVFALGSQALTGVFPKKENDFVTAGPVTLVKCNSDGGCGLLQLRESYSLDSMYGDNYGYRSGLNPHMVSHLKKKVQRIMELGVLTPGDTVIDIGSNDCTTLKAYPSDLNLIGIDPTGEKFLEYYPKHVKLVPDFFSKAVVKKRLSNICAKVITSFSMFYDLENPVAFAKDICDCLDDEGIWIFEQSYLPSMLETVSFDTICHEHLEFYSLKQIDWILEAAGLKVIDVELNDINGGSFSITAAKTSSSNFTDTKKILKIRSREEDLKLDSLDTYANFFQKVSRAKSQLLEFIENAKSEGKSIYGLGASTKGNVLLQYFGLTQDDIISIAEVNADKFGCFTPGTRIPIEDQSRVLEKNPDYLLVLPWHFKDFFTNAKVFKGQKLVFPLPYLHVIET